MMQVGANPSMAYHSQTSMGTPVGQAVRSSSTSRQQQSQYENDQLANIRPRLCTLRKWPHYDGYGVHLARNQHWLGLRIGDVEPNSPAESGGLLREDVVLAVNGHSVENDDFFVILSYIQHELEDDQIRFLVLDPQSLDVAHRHQLAIDENFPTCVRMETPTLTLSAEQVLYQQWRSTANTDPISSHNTIHLGRSTSSNTIPSQLNTERHSSSSTRDNIFTFPPYSDHAIENGKSLFEILFDQDSNLRTASKTKTQKSTSGDTSFINKSTTNGNESIVQETDDPKADISRAISDMRDGVKNFVKSGIGNLKASLPTRHHDDTDKENSTDSKAKITDESPVERSEVMTSPSFIEKLKKKFKNKSSSEQEKIQDPSVEQQWETSTESDDANANARLEPRLCSVKLRPGWENIGISLQPDRDCGHIIKQVEPNSPAARAGIERDDCIISLNDTPMLNVPYDGVLSIIQNSRHYLELDFLVAKKAYLLKSWPSNNATATHFHETPEKYGDASPASNIEVLPSANFDTNKNVPSNAANDTLEKLYNKYVHEKKPTVDHSVNVSQINETSAMKTNDDRHERITTQVESDLYPSKQNQGKIIQGVGPATADNRAWNENKEKSIELLPSIVSGDGSVRSTSRAERVDSKDSKSRDQSLENSFKPLQVGITNPSAAQQTTGTSPVSNRGHGIEELQHVTRVIASTDNRETITRRVSSPTPDDDSSDDPPLVIQNKPNATIQKLQEALVVTPVVPTALLASRNNDQVLEEDSSPKSVSTLGSVRATNPINMPVKIATPAVYYDTDDDNLSDISEKSHEDETSDLGLRKDNQPQTPNITNNSADKVAPEFSVATFPEQIPTINVIGGTSEPNSPASEVPTDEACSVVPETRINFDTRREVIRAKRIEESDSDETTSERSSIPNDPSIGEHPRSSGAATDDEDESDQLPLEKSVSETPNTQMPDHSSDADHKLIEQISSDTEKSKTPDAQIESSSTDNTQSIEKTSPQIQTKLSSPSSSNLATVPIDQLRDHDYELHKIQLMQPTEQNPVGLKLTKQQEPLQFIITAVAKGTKADLAGLKVNDWLIKIEDEDVRTVEFTEVSRQIRQLLTDSGMINMVIARKRASNESMPTIVTSKPPKLVQTGVESIGRAQGSSIPTSILTTDITRDTPNNEQVRFIPEPQISPTVASQRARTSSRENKPTGTSAPLAIGLTNPIADETSTRSTRSISQSPNRSPTREYTVSETKQILLPEVSDDIDPKDIRVILMKEALGLDFNSFIPDGDSQTQTHFISNVQPSSMADKAGLRDGDRILKVNGIDVTNSVHEDVRHMMQSKKPLQLTVFNDPKYLDLIENVRRSKKKTNEGHNQTSPSPPDYETITNTNSANISDSNVSSRFEVRSPTTSLENKTNDRRRSSDRPKSREELEAFNLHTIFEDDKGEVQVKCCVLKKFHNYNGYGLLLRYLNNLHLIDQVEQDSPAFNAGLREEDIILFVDGRNVEKMSHEDVKNLIRKLSVANTPINLILMKKNKIQRYYAYKENNDVDWVSMFPTIVTEEVRVQSETQQSVESPLTRTQIITSEQNQSPSPTQKQAAPIAPVASPPSIVPETRTCILEIVPKTAAGFALSGKNSSPYTICSIDANSPASRAGLRLNDAILSINGTSVVASSYEDTVKLVRNALQKNPAEFVVRSQPTADSKDKLDTLDRTRMGSNVSANLDTNKSSTRASDISTQDALRSSSGAAGSSYGTNPVEEYQKQRNKELSYTLRLCHLHPTNIDGSQAITFGFELSEAPDFEYPIILRVEQQSPAETAGLQSRDILLRVNDRKTKGLGYEKVKKEIEKAKRDGRLEMLVVDQETFDYCTRTKKPLKEPEMKIKHIFPKSRSSASFHKLPTASTMSSPSSRDSTEKLNDLESKESVDKPYFHAPISSGSFSANIHHMGSSQENESDEDEKKDQLSSSSPMLKDDQVSPARPSDYPRTASSPTVTHASASASAIAPQTSSQYSNPQMSSFDQRSHNSATVPSTLNMSQSASAVSQPSTGRHSNKDSKGSKSKVLPNAINNLFHRIGHSKSSKRS